MITTVELREWAGITGTDAATVAALDWSVDTANALVARRCVPMVDPWPAEVTTAALIQAARVYKRRGSPEGVSGFADFGPVRIASWDSDIETGLAPYLRIVFA